jgi:uncharacterized protein YqeY
VLLEVTLPDRMRSDLKDAMRARNTARVTVLRTALAAFANAEAPPARAEPVWPPVEHGASEVARLELTDDDHRRILDELITDREDTAATYDSNGRTEEADVMRAEIATLAAYR